MIKGTLDGEEAPELVTRDYQMVFSSRGYEVHYAGTLHDQGEMALVPHGDGLRLELKGKKGPNAGRTLPAIYQQRGELLRVCYGLDGIVPDDFTAAAGSARYLVLYRRQP